MPHLIAKIPRVPDEEVRVLVEQRRQQECSKEVARRCEGHRRPKPFEVAFCPLAVARLRG